MESLLRTNFPDHVSIQAYADDIAISIAGPTRNSIIQRAELALIPILEWEEARGLSFSATKSQALMTKGDLVPGFTVAFGNDKIVSVDSVKYLGLWLDSDRSYKTHVKSLVESKHNLFSRLRGASGSGWGIRRTNLMILYR